MALSNELRAFITDLKDGAMDGRHIGDREGLEMLGAVINQMEAAASLIQWDAGAEGLNGGTANTKGVSASATPLEDSASIKITDANDVPMALSQGNSVDVTPTLVNGAADLYLKDADGNYQAWSGATTVELVDGEATLEFKVTLASATDAVQFAMGNGPAGKTLDSTYTITAS